MTPLEISSPQNPRIKRLLSLRKRGDRDQEGVFVIEGYREILRALEAKWPIDELYFSTDLFLGGNENALLARAEKVGTRLFSCSAPVFRKVAYRDRPDGLLAVAPQRHHRLQDLPKSPNPFFLVMVGIEKPGNLGTMLRAADGAGIDAVIVCDPVTDIFNPNTVRASVGTLFSVPVIESTRDELLPWLRQNGISLLAATPHATHSLYHSNLSRPLAIAVGSEMLGLSDPWMDAADLKVSLPMNGIADSLNVSTCAAIMLYEGLRQRAISVHP